MENNKILDLSYVADEDFEMIRDAIEGWKNDGMMGRVYYPSAEEIEQRMRDVYTVMKNGVKTGRMQGALGVLAAIGLGELARRWFMRSEKKD